MYKQQGSGELPLPFLCCWAPSPPLPLGLVKSLALLWPHMSPQPAPKNHRASWEKHQQYFVAVLVCERSCLQMYARAHTHAHTDVVTYPIPLKPIVVFLGDKQGQLMRGKTRVNEWHNPGSHVSLTHDILKAFLCFDHHLLTFFFFFLSFPLFSGAEPAAAGGYSHRGQAPG